jgi:hypothetical protein
VIEAQYARLVAVGNLQGQDMRGGSLTAPMAKVENGAGVIFLNIIASFLNVVFVAIGLEIVSRRLLGLFVYGRVGLGKFPALVVADDTGQRRTILFQSALLGHELSEVG